MSDSARSLVRQSSSAEYRVRWRREGHGHSYRIYQTKAAAFAKAERILALEACKEDTTFADMPDLIETPIVQERPVGDWEMAEDQPAEPSEESIDGMRQWAAPGDDSGYGPF